MTDAASSSASTPRYDFFQTATQVIVSFYVKGCRQDDVQLDVSEGGLVLTIVSPSPAVNTRLSPLYAPVDTSNSAVRALSTKVEVSLQKKFPGNQWPKLLGAPDQAAMATAAPAADTVPSPSAPQAPSSRQRSKWDSFQDDDEKKEDGDIDSFFKKLYADADDDTRRAMMKSYQESGGTALSTNWQDVSKGKVETTPPDGMEARRWGN